MGGEKDSGEGMFEVSSHSRGADFTTSCMLAVRNEEPSQFRVNPFDM